MLADRCLASVEELELTLARRAQVLGLDSSRTHRGSCPRSTALSVCVLVVMSSLLRTLIQVMKAFSLLHADLMDMKANGWIHSSVKAKSSLSAQPTPYYTTRTRISKLTANITRLDDPDHTLRVPLGDGVTCLCSSTVSQSSEAVLATEIVSIPDSENLPAISVYINIRSNQVLGATLGYPLSSRKRMKLMRKFGLDEVPVKLAESINLSTDRLIVDDAVSISFNRDFIAA